MLVQLLIAAGVVLFPLPALYLGARNLLKRPGYSVDEPSDRASYLMLVSLRALTCLLVVALSLVTLVSAVGALVRGVGYVGALGSRRTQTARRTHLLNAAVGERDLARLRGPAGLDLGGGSPAETAVAVVAEILAVRSGREARPLSGGSGPINT